ncbi:MAG: DUF1501 domain-containing protein [Armatimonadota bacterium]
MIRIGSVASRNCGGVTRRELLQVGGAGIVGLSLADSLRAEAAESRSGGTEPRDRACIFLWLDGGPSQFETFDPKPEAPSTQRGPYAAIPTSVSGLQYSELVPMLAERAHLFTTVRSLTHSIDSHSPLPMMTASQRDTTSHGAVVTYLRGHRGNMPPYVHLGKPLPVGGGKLGAAFNPVAVQDPTGSKVQLPDFHFPADVNPLRFDRRRRLLGAVDEFRREVDANRGVAEMDAYYQRAMAMLTSSAVTEAFDLKREPEKLRERYGGSFFGQSCLLARRLVEAGTKFVQVKWYDGPAWNAWDTHGADTGGLTRMEQHLCPRLDLGLSALLDDLRDRGLLESTLVVAIGEFGRTGVNKLGGRDHWPSVFSGLLAGGGAPTGLVVGSSDSMGRYPADRPISPGDFAATLYRLLGINPNVEDRVRPFIAGGSSVDEIAGTA